MLSATQGHSGSLDSARSSRGPRRLSPSASASASGLGRVHGPNTGPLPSVGGRGEMGHRGPSRWDLACCWGGLPGLAVPLARRAAAWRGRGLPDSGALCSLGTAPGRRRGGRARRRSVALPVWVWAGAYGGWAEWEPRESTRLGSTDSVRFPRENGADRGGQETRFGDGRGAPPTGGRF